MATLPSSAYHAIVTQPSLVAQPAVPSVDGPGTGRRLRPFALPSADQRIVNISRYQQWLNVVVFFHHGVTCRECRETLRLLAQNAPRCRDEDTIVIGVGPDEPATSNRFLDELERPILLLSDPRGAAARQHGVGAPSLLVADRFGDVWVTWEGGQRHELPKPAEILTWLEAIGIHCPDCGVQDWPPLLNDVLME
jgi:peroxiredoxin